MGLFGKDSKSNPKEQGREWISKLRKQNFQLDRQIRAIQREEAKVKSSLKDAAKKGDKSACLVLARSLIDSKKAIEKLNVSKAQIGSVMLHLNQSLSNLKVAGAMEKSTEVMKSMQNLVRIHEISQTMQEMSKEMMKAGIIGEMMEETIDEAVNIDEDEMEEQVQAEVDKILNEVTQGAMGKIAELKPQTEIKETKETPQSESESEEEEINAMRERLQALRS
ncbi:vacuolar protein sorting 24 isoform X2 [Brevipalpus obovatus]|uniref:vacuolar protein sorting 24 isoform X2 n=1 Tax=Brevipalpus obovatus TaxID=246614 RepID=UPI003D9F281F